MVPIATSVVRRIKYYYYSTVLIMFEGHSTKKDSLKIFQISKDKKTCQTLIDEKLPFPAFKEITSTWRIFFQKFRQ